MRKSKKHSDVKTYDMMHAMCVCGGSFREMSLHDDWDGVLTCDSCGIKIKRYTGDDDAEYACRG